MPCFGKKIDISAKFGFFNGVLDRKENRLNYKNAT